MFERFRRSTETEGTPRGGAATAERPEVGEPPAPAEQPEAGQRPATAERPGADEPAALADLPATTRGSAADDLRAADVPDGRRRFARDGADRSVDARDRVVGREPIGERRTLAPVLAPETLALMRERQRERFGGLAWGCAFFGWLAAAGLGAMLAGMLAAAGAALNLTDGRSAQTIGLGGGIALLAVLMVAYFAGGHVAGRMARFDGARQGVGVWAWGVVAALVVAAVAAIGGSRYNVLDRLNLPRIPVHDGTLTTGGAIALAAILAGTVLAAVAGGKLGDRYHRRIDRVAVEERVVDEA